MNKEKIKLSNGQSYEINNIYYLFNLFKIEFDESIDVDKLTDDPSIFNEITILTRNGEECGKYENYTTIYQSQGNIVTLSNDESVYIEKTNTSIDDPTLPEPEPCQYEASLEEIRQFKITKLSNICNESIENGVDLDIDGVVKHFSYKMEDQNNIKDKFDMAIQTRLGIPYHANGENIEIYTSDQIIDLYISQKLNLAHHLTYFNQLKMYINTLEDKDTIQSVLYGEELSGKYLENYNIALDQERLLLNYMINNSTIKEEE